MTVAPRPCLINQVDERCGNVWRGAPRVLLDIDAHPRPAVSIAKPTHDAVRGVSAQIGRACAPLPPPSTWAMQEPDLTPVVPHHLGSPRPAEARWFIVGDIDAELRPRGLPQ